MLGQTLGHFEILEQLGHGGMGEVFLALDTRLDRKVAIKILASDRGATHPPKLASSRLARLRREATALARLDHPNIVSVYSIEEVDDLVFVVMEWVDGVRLRDLIPARGFGLGRFLELAIPIARALDAAHTSGVVHRDLKPENIMVRRNDSVPESTVKVLDFGLAQLYSEDDRTADETLTGAKQVIGTLPYMSPEQLLGDEVGPRSDLFSLATVFHEMLTGQRPFSGDSSTALSMAILYDSPPDLTSSGASFPPPLSAIVEHCHEKDPRDRPSSARLVVSALEALRDGKTLSQETETLVSEAQSSTSARTITQVDLDQDKRSSHHARERRRISIALALAAAVMAAVIAFRFVPNPLADEASESMVVLPFENLTGNSDLAYLATGLSASLLARLHEVGDIRLLGRSHVEDTVSSGETPGRIAQRAGARYVVDGVLQGSADQLSIAVTLTDSKDGTVVWSENYRSRLESLFSLESTLTSDLVRVLSIKLSARERDRVGDAQVDSWQAFDLFLKAQKLIDHQEGQDDLDLAISLLDRASGLDPTFARAHAAASEAHWQRFAQSRDAADLDLAETAARRALELDQQLPAGRLALARVLRSRGQAESSIEAVDELLADIPRKDDAYRELAFGYERIGDLDSARLFYRAATLFNPDAWYNWNELGVLQNRMGEYDEAIRALQTARDLAPEDVTSPLENLGSVRIQQGDFEGALLLFDKIDAPTRNGRLASNIATAYFFSERDDRYQKAEQYYRLAARLEPTVADIQANLADVLVLLSKQDEANQHYRRALELTESDLEIEHGKEAGPIDGFHPLRLKRATFAAKAGLCPQALSEAEQLFALLPDTAEDFHLLAYPLALCGARTRAIDALERSVALGFSPELIEREEEFKTLDDELRFRRLVDGP